jgi:hypothetical protein
LTIQGLTISYWYNIPSVLADILTVSASSR